MDYQGKDAANDRIERANQIKRSTARLSIVSNTLLAAMKLAFYGKRCGMISHQNAFTFLK